MNRILKHILPLLTVIFFASCSDKDEAKVISRGKMADIYAEMLMTDQWINSTPNVRKIADTSLVYEPILEKYGYSQKDYLKSVDHYMNDPERFARILRSSGEKLGRKLKELITHVFFRSNNFQLHDRFCQRRTGLSTSVLVSLDSTDFERQLVRVNRVERTILQNDLH